MKAYGVCTSFVMRPVCQTKLALPGQACVAQVSGWVYNGAAARQLDAGLQLWLTNNCCTTYNSCKADELMQMQNCTIRSIRLSACYNWVSVLRQHAAQPQQHSNVSTSSITSARPFRPAPLAALHLDPHFRSTPMAATALLCQRKRHPSQFVIHKCLLTSFSCCPAP